MRKILPTLHSNKKQIIVAFLVIVIAFVSRQNANAQITTQYAFGIGNSLTAASGEIATDSDGNYIIMGEFHGLNVDFDPGTNTKLLSSAGNADIYVAKYSPTGSLIFAFNIGGTELDAGGCVKTDTAGNIYISGWFRGTVDFDPSSNTANLVSNGDLGTDPGFGGDAFLAKYNSSGQYQWALNIGSSSILDYGAQIYIDSNGDVLWGGSFTGTNVDFDPSSNTAFLSSPGVTSSYLAKYTSDGTFIYAKVFGGATVVNCALRDIVEDNTGNIYILGHFDGTMDANPDAGVNNLVSNGCGDIYVIKLNSNAQLVWAFNLGGNNCDYPWAMTMDATNNIYITGQLTSTNVDFNPGVGFNTISTHGLNDIFIAKYDQNGNYVFANAIGSSGEDAGYAIDVRDNSLILTGYFSGTVDFNPSTENNTLSSNGDRDIFVVKYDLDGNYKTSFNIGSSSNDYGRGVEFMDGDNIVIVGAFQGTNVNFAPTGSPITISSNGDYDIFVAKYTLNSTLPVTVIDFFGTIKNRTIAVLNWTVTNEQQIDKYIVESSPNGIEFIQVGAVNSKGNTLTNVTYQFEDRKTFNGDNFYRIKIVEKDGSINYTKTTRLNVSSISTMNVYPNPVRNILNIKVSGEIGNKPVRVLIINQVGQILYNNYHIQGTGGKIDINVANYTSGNYIVQLINEQGVIGSTKFIKQ